VAAVFLRGGGYQVIEAGCGSEALEQAARHRGMIHLLISDIIMPGMNGHALAQELAASRPQMAVLYISGFTDQSLIERTKLKRDDFLQKPFTRNELLARVRMALESRAADKPKAKAFNNVTAS